MEIIELQPDIFRQFVQLSPLQSFFVIKLTMRSYSHVVDVTSVESAKRLQTTKTPQKLQISCSTELDLTLRKAQQLQRRVRVVHSTSTASDEDIKLNYFGSH
jgi:protein-tyrosine phosphatase